MTSGRAASRVDSHRNLLFVPSPTTTTTTTTHHDQGHGEEQCQENSIKLFSSWKKKKKTTMRKQTEEEMSPNSMSSGLRDCCKRLRSLFCCAFILLPTTGLCLISGLCLILFERVFIFFFFAVDIFILDKS